MLADGLAARLRDARARRLPAALGRARGPLLRRAVGRQRPGQRRHGDPRPRWPSARLASRSAPAAPTRTGTRPCARRWARCSPCPWPACATVAELPGRAVALVARDGVPLHELRRARCTLVVGAERDGLPADVVAACDDVAHIPIAHADSLNAAMAATVALYELN